MKIEIGNIMLDEWLPSSYDPDSSMRSNINNVYDKVLIFKENNKQYFVTFHGECSRYHQHYMSYIKSAVTGNVNTLEKAQACIDKFLIKMSKLIVFM